MATGKIAKIVHLTLQSAASADCSPALKGYGYIEADGERIYFEPKAVKLYSFDDLQPGQEVEFERDAKYASAKSVEIKGELVHPPEPVIGGQVE